jgi:transposase
MAARFVRIDRETRLLLPPDMREWVPENHMSQFILDAVEEMDLSAAKVNHRGSGSEQYPPGMLLCLLIYSYSSGVFSSRSIERASYDSVATKVLCADSHPDHDTICAFRRENRELLEQVFSSVLEMAARVGVMKVGNVTVAIDGTKILANASKHAAASYQKAGEAMRELDLEIAELLKRAEEADSTPLQDGLSVSGEVARREERKAKLKAARAEMEVRAVVRAAAEREEYEAKKAEREAMRERGKKPRGKDPREPENKPGSKDQVNFTDPESRIMPCGGKTNFEQAYNAQAGVEIESRLIVTKRVSQASNDKRELLGNVRVIDPVIQSVERVLIDSGFVSEAAVKEVEQTREDGRGVPEVLAAIKRERHHRSVADLEKRDDPSAPGEEASFSEKMAYRVATKEGRVRYKQRQQTIEPVFGIIKEAIGFRRFSLRGLGKVALEWTLVCMSYNLRRLHRMVSIKSQNTTPAWA